MYSRFHSMIMIIYDIMAHISDMKSYVYEINCI